MEQNFVHLFIPELIFAIGKIRYDVNVTKKIIFINQKDKKDDFENQNIGGKVISEIKSAKEINVIFSNESKSLEDYYC